MTKRQIRPRRESVADSPMGRMNGNAQTCSVVKEGSPFIMEPEKNNQIFKLQTPRDIVNGAVSVVPGVITLTGKDDRL